MLTPLRRLVLVTLMTVSLIAGMGISGVSTAQANERSPSSDIYVSPVSDPFWVFLGVLTDYVIGYCNDGKPSDEVTPMGDEDASWSSGGGTGR